MYEIDNINRKEIQKNDQSENYLSNIRNFYCHKNFENLKLINPKKSESNSCIRNIVLSNIEGFTSFDSNLLKINGFENKFKTRKIPIYHSKSHTNSYPEDNFKIFQNIRKRNCKNFTNLIEANKKISPFTFLKISFIKKQIMNQKKITKMKIINDSKKIRSKNIILPTLNSLNKTSHSIFDFN